MQFSYVNPTQIHFGQGQIEAISTAIPTSSNVLLVYGGGSIKKNGVYEQVIDALKGHDWEEFSGVEPNPTKETLDKAVEIVKQDNIEFVLGVGGGSVIDGVKYIAAAAKYDGDGWDILEGKHEVSEALALGAVLTLPATGSESNAAAVITRRETQDKLAFYHPKVQPQFAILDPDVMKTLPDRQLINGIIDAWMHVCEQYLTKPNGAMVQDAFAESLLNILKELGERFEQRDNDEWRANLMWAANQSLNGLIGSGVPHDWATHAIGHELTALYGIDHAHSLAIIQPSLLRNQLSNKKATLEQLGRNVFGLTESNDLALITIEAMESFYQSFGIKTQLIEHDTDKSTAVRDVLAKLEEHGQMQLGENGSITLSQSKAILESAIA